MLAIRYWLLCRGSWAENPTIDFPASNDLIKQQVTNNQ
jgi:hypothetical protein